MNASYGIGWDSSKGTFWLKMHGTMKALGQEWNLREIHLKDTVSAANFENFAKLGQRFCEEFATQFRDMLTNWFNLFRGDFTTITNFLYHQLKLSYTDVVRGIGSVFSMDDWRPMVNSVVSTLQSGMHFAVEIMRNLGLSAESVGRMARQVFNVAMKGAQKLIDEMKFWGYQA